MSTGDCATEIGHACPHLGLVGDPSTRCLFVNDSHRCYAGPRPVPVAPEEQTAYCLSEGYAGCRRPSGGGDPAPSRRRRLPVVRSRIPVSRTGATSRMAMGAAAGVAGLAVVAIGFQLLSQLPATPAPTSTPSAVSSSVPAAGEAGSNPAAGTGVSPFPASSPTPAAGPQGALPLSAGQATAVPTRASPTAPPRPSPTVAAGTTYVVRPGDSLFGLAQQYGLTVEELVRTNGLTDRNYIWSGQRLVIPASSQ